MWQRKGHHGIQHTLTVVAKVYVLGIREDRHCHGMEEGIKESKVKENGVGCWKKIKSSNPYTSALERWESAERFLAGKRYDQIHFSK